jgi:hypothetical protein
MKLEEAAAAVASGDGANRAPKVETDNDLVDQLIHMPDYPSNRAEALAMSQYSANVNCYFEIYQV